MSVHNALILCRIYVIVFRLVSSRVYRITFLVQSIPIIFISPITCQVQEVEEFFSFDGMETRRLLVGNFFPLEISTQVNQGAYNVQSCQ